VVIAVIVVAVAAVLVVMAVTKATGISRVPTGPGTATITWTLPGGSSGSSGSSGAPEAFSGTVDGISFSGTATGESAVTTTVPSIGQPAKVTPPLGLARWTGTFAGAPFTLDVAESFTTGGSTVHNKLIGGVFLVYRVTGTVGSEPVRITGTPGEHDFSVITFTGTVGPLHVKGTLGKLHENGKTGTTRVSFTVTR
jgi:hypothetical protein